LVGLESQKQHLGRSDDNWRRDLLRVALYVPDNNSVCKQDEHRQREVRYRMLTEQSEAAVAAASLETVVAFPLTPARSLLHPINAMRQFGSYFCSSLTQNCARM
jgi:hypothetical protein